MKFILCNNAKQFNKIQIKLFKKGYNWGFTSKNFTYKEQLLIFQESQFPLFILLEFETNNKYRLYWGETNEIQQDSELNKHLRKEKLTQLKKKFF
jgi:hypothetical protein